VDRAPGRPAVPGVLAPTSSRRLDGVDEEDLLRHTTTRRRLSPLLRRAPPSRPSPRVSESVLPRVKDDDVRTDSFFFFFSFLLREPAKVLLGWLGGSLAR
jgi:hypothetical protein